MPVSLIGTFAAMHLCGFSLNNLSLMALTVWLFIQVPKTFMPEQDTGRLSGSISADQSISFQAIRKKLQDFMVIVKTIRRLKAWWALPAECAPTAAQCLSR